MIWSISIQYSTVDHQLSEEGNDNSPYLHYSPPSFLPSSFFSSRLQKVFVNDYDLVIVSYDIIRNDIDFFS